MENLHPKYMPRTQILLRLLKLASQKHVGHTQDEQKLSSALRACSITKNCGMAEVGRDLWRHLAQHPSSGRAT